MIEAKESVFDRQPTESAKEAKTGTSIAAVTPVEIFALIDVTEDQVEEMVQLADTLECTENAEAPGQPNKIVMLLDPDATPL